MNFHHKNKNGETGIVELVETFQRLKGLRLIIELFKWVITGVFMGASDAIPGYSGGTTLALTGFFRRLIMIAKSVFVPEPGLTRMKALSFMLPFAVGWIAGIFGFAKLTEMLAHHGLGVELLLFFAFFVLFAIPVFLKGNSPQLGKNGEAKGKKFRWFLFIVGFVVVLTIAILMQVLKHGAPFHGHEKAANGKDNFDLASSWWKLFLIAYGAGLVTIMPGGSGALIQLLANYYPIIHWNIMANAFQSGENFAGLVVFGLASFSGMLTVVFACSWLLKYHEHTLSALSFGMLIASFFAILIVVNVHDSWDHMTHWYHIVGGIVAACLGVGTGLAIHWHVNRKANKVSTPVIKN